MPAGDAEPPPIDNHTIAIVSGLPRSGTSMMMQMLAAGGLATLVDDARPADESNPRGYHEFAPAKQLATDRRWLADARGKAVKVVAQLLPCLPPTYSYRIIFMERPLNEVMASQRALLSRLERTGGSTSDAELAETFRQQVSSVREIVQRHRDRVSLLAVGYHQALANPAETCVRINRFLGGSLDPTRMAAAIQPALRNQC